MGSIPDVAAYKTYLGITGSQDDGRLAAIAAIVPRRAERATGRLFAAGSHTLRYSTNGASSLIIHDRPYIDGTRQVILSGVTMEESTNVWFLPDRRNPDITATIQLDPFDMGDSRWYLRHGNWFDANLDSPRYRTGAPLDLE